MPKTGSNRKTGSRGGSTSRPVTPNVAEAMAAYNTDDEGWVCKLCSVLHTSQEAKLLECDRCREKFCVSCLNKTDEEYEMMKLPDIMWFCAECREKVEKNIVTERKIEEMCREIMLNYEQRICELEEEIKKKCDRDEVVRIVEDSIARAANAKSSQPEDRNDSNPEIVESLMSEVNERKIRENNVVMFGLPEINMENREDRTKRDIKLVGEVAQSCGITIEDDDVKSVRRLGKYDANKMKRPLLLTLRKPEKKRELFKKAEGMKGTKFNDVRISNDLTKAERDKERELFNSAKRMQEQDHSGNFLYKVRGPPWARKVVKIKKAQ